MLINFKCLNNFEELDSVVYLDGSLVYLEKYCEDKHAISHVF